jgi:hypothetical protein
MSQSVDALERVLRRTALPRGQITLLKALYERDGDWAAYANLVDQIRWGEPERFPGVLGAFSRPINETDGIRGKPGYGAFIERRRIDGELHYRLRPESRRAVERISVLLEAFDRSMRDLLEGFTIEAEDLSS